MRKENKRNRKENKQELIARVDNLRPYIKNKDYVNILREKYPEFAEVKKSKFYCVMRYNTLDENIIKKMECLFLPKKELV